MAAATVPPGSSAVVISRNVRRTLSTATGRLAPSAGTEEKITGGCVSRTIPDSTVPLSSPWLLNAWIERALSPSVSTTVVDQLVVVSTGTTPDPLSRIPLFASFAPVSNCVASPVGVVTGCSTGSAGATYSSIQSA